MARSGPGGGRPPRGRRSGHRGRQVPVGRHSGALPVQPVPAGTVIGVDGPAPAVIVLR